MGKSAGKGGWIDFEFASFESDEWRFAAVCIVVIGFAIIPALFMYLIARRRNDQAFQLGLSKANLSLEQAKTRRLKKSGKGPKRWK